MKRQRGVTLGGVFIFMILIGFGAYAASRVLPGYMEYWTLQRILRNVLELPDVKDLKEGAIRTKFAKELQINNMDTAINDNLEVEWVPNGVRLAVEFSMKRPFMGPVSICMNFRAEETSK
jgi:hypothetical protein